MERLTKYGDTSHENKVCCTHSTLGKHKYHSRADLMIDKTVFLTREAAEEALRREQDDEEHHIL